MDIQLLHLSKCFDKKQVLNDVNLTFMEGYVNCLMGASGIGKTTILHLLMGLVKPDAGKILGMEDRRVAVIFQEDRLIEHWNAVENVRLVCDKQVTQKMIEEEFQKVGLEEYKEKPVRSLSGGMRRRVAIVRAMLAQSNLVIMDEPFKGLDESLKNTVIAYVRQKTAGKTVILVTHDKEEIPLLEGKLLLME